MVPVDDPDKAFASLRDQGLPIEHIDFPARTDCSASESDRSDADYSPFVISWPRRMPAAPESLSKESISFSLPGPPIRIVVISDTHSLHQRIIQV